MRVSHRRFALLLVGLLAAGMAIVDTSCAGDKPEEPKPNIIQYTVRGVVMNLPADDRPASEFVVRHEPVPSYMMGGKVVGMKSMQMPFPLEDGLCVRGLSVGQKIELSFEVEYNEAGSPVNVFAVSVKPLPRDTALHFE
jgi:hypothetical protein